MARKRRIHYTETDKAVMWDRWQKGESLEKIAQLFDRSHGSVARILRQTGGIRPLKRARSTRTLSLAERKEISRGVVPAVRYVRSQPHCIGAFEQLDDSDWNNAVSEFFAH